MPSDRRALVRSLLMFKLNEQARQEAEIRRSQEQLAAENRQFERNTLLRSAEKGVFRPDPSLHPSANRALNELAVSARLQTLSATGSAGAEGGESDKNLFSQALLESSDIFNAPVQVDVGDTTRHDFAPDVVTRAAKTVDPTRLDQLGRNIREQQGVSRRALQVKGRETDIQIRKEDRANAVDSLAQITANTYTDPGDKRLHSMVDDSRNRLMQQFGVDEGRRMHSLAMNRADELYGKQLWFRLSAQGRDASGRLEDAVAEAQRLQENNLPMSRLSPGHKARLAMNGFLYSSPITGQQRFVDTGDAKKFKQTETDLNEVLYRISDLEDAYSLVETNSEFATGLYGLDFVQDFARITQIQNPYAAAYVSTMREMLSILLRARQGSRPSDWDIHFYLSLFPSLSEIGAESGRARMNALKLSLYRSATAAYDPFTLDRLQGLKNEPKTELDKKLERQAERVDRLRRQDAPTDVQAKAAAEFEKTREIWNEKRAPYYQKRLKEIGVIPQDIDGGGSFTDMPEADLIEMRGKY